MCECESVHVCLLVSLFEESGGKGRAVCVCLLCSKF